METDGVYGRTYCSICCTPTPQSIKPPAPPCETALTGPTPLPALHQRQPFLSQAFLATPTKTVTPGRGMNTVLVANNRLCTPRHHRRPTSNTTTTPTPRTLQQHNHNRLALRPEGARKQVKEAARQTLPEHGRAPERERAVGADREARRVERAGLRGVVELELVVGCYVARALLGVGQNAVCQLDEGGGAAGGAVLVWLACFLF